VIGKDCGVRSPFTVWDISETALDFLISVRPVAQGGKQVVRPLAQNGARDLRLALHGVDGDEAAVQGKALQ
jgi:hypothetical protein